eukprot:10306414-Lingulodinium_polyedra.AAC.1
MTLARTRNNKSSSNKLRTEAMSRSESACGAGRVAVGVRRCGFGPCSDTAAHVALAGAKWRAAR